VSLLKFNDWRIINEASVAFDATARYTDQTFGFPQGGVDSGKVVLGGEGGNWGGSLPRAMWFAKVACDFMLATYPTVFKDKSQVLTSQKRSRKNTASGNTSDHYNESTTTYAVDLAVGGDASKQTEAGKAALARGNALLAHLMAAFGHPEYKGGSWFNAEVGGYRYQVGWLVTNHYDHIHVGVAKSGATSTSTTSTTASSTSSITVTGSTFSERILSHPLFKQWALMSLPEEAANLQAKDIDAALLKPKAKEWFMTTFSVDSEGMPIAGSQIKTDSTDLTAPTAVSTGTITKADKDFDKVVATVIDKLEGGYFHPNMRTKNPSKFGAYHRSGETMFGLDRHAGHGLYYSTDRKDSDVLDNLKYIENGSYEYASTEAKEFWETIDKADAKNKWEWNYRGGTLESRLRYLAGRIMKKQFDSLFSQYLSKKAQEIVNSDGRLMFNFIYASWNGSGWFEKWAKDFNKMVETGETNTDTLLNSIVNKRKTEGLSKGSAANSLISQGGDKIKKIVGLA
jgi:hypothetical protein